MGASCGVGNLRSACTRRSLIPLGAPRSRTRRSVPFLRSALAAISPPARSRMQCLRRKPEHRIPRFRSCCHHDASRTVEQLPTLKPAKACWLLASFSFHLPTVLSSLKRRISKSQQADQRLLPLSFFGKGRNVGIFIIFATQKKNPSISRRVFKVWGGVYRTNRENHCSTMIFVFANSDMPPNMPPDAC